MNWEVVASTGEWAGAIAVVFTLLYLARQINQQNEIAKYDAWSSIIAGLNITNEIQAKDADLTRLVKAGFDSLDDLDDDEVARWSHLIRIYYNNIYRAYRAYELGFIDEATWADLAANFSRDMQTPGGVRFREAHEQLFPDMWSSVDRMAAKSTAKVDYWMGRSSEANE